MSRLDEIEQRIARIRADDDGAFGDPSSQLLWVFADGCHYDDLPLIETRPFGLTPSGKPHPYYPPERLLHGHRVPDSDLRLLVCSDVPMLLARIRALETALALIADGKNWDYFDDGTVWTYQANDGQRPEAQEIARAALAGES